MNKQELRAQTLAYIEAGRVGRELARWPNGKPESLRQQALDWIAERDAYLAELEWQRLNPPKPGEDYCEILDCTAQMDPYGEPPELEAEIRRLLSEQAQSRSSTLPAPSVASPSDSPR